MTNPIQQLHDLGQSLWLDNMTREMLQDGTLRNYIKELSITGLTSNPSIFDLAIKSGAYDDSIHAQTPAGLSSEDLFFQLAGEDLSRAAGRPTTSTAGSPSRCRPCWLMTRSAPASR
jgi:transaldolase